MAKELWKDIDRFTNYQVSDQGRVRNKITNQVLKPGRGGVGYLTVALYKDKKSYSKNVHQLVSDAFIGKGTKGMTVNHKDGNKLNNNLSNLELVTRRANNVHAYETGLNPHRKAVRIVETGEIFDSQIKCAEAIDGDAANISSCLNGKLGSHKGLHFERVEKPTPVKQRKPFLYDYQKEAVKKMRNGCILNGGVGSGKSRTGLYYYFSQQGGSKDPDYVPMKNPKDLYIITTAQKRDTLEWQQELVPFLMSTNPEINSMLYKHKVTVDSWNNIQKYADVKGAFFLYDEQRVCGSGAWVKTFLKLAKSNDWILLSATAGDTWMDYAPVFIANGFYKNRTEFKREHVIYKPYAKFPQIDRYIGTNKLLRLRDSILVSMDFKRETIAHHEDVYCSYNVEKYKDIMRNRWDPYENKPIENASRLCYLLRKIVNTDESRVVALMELLEKTPRAIIFYNFDHELEMLRGLYYGEGVEVAEWNGHKHEPVPKSEKWVYFVQYTAGNAGWNCITTDTIIFFSQNYSYKIMLQAAGRIDRLNTPYKDLYYYHLKTRSGIDLAISRALKDKKQFNERKFTKWDK